MSTSDENERRPCRETLTMFITVGAVIGTAGILLKYGRVTDREVVTRQAKPKIPSIGFKLVTRCRFL